MYTIDSKKLIKALPKLFFFVLLWTVISSMITILWNPTGWPLLCLLVVEFVVYFEILHRCTNHCVIREENNE